MAHPSRQDVVPMKKTEAVTIRLVLRNRPTAAIGCERVSGSEPSEEK